MATSTPPGTTASEPHALPPSPQRLYRRTDEKMIGGVAAGMADYFSVDVTVVRLAAVLLAFAGPGVIVYVAAWILVPSAPPGTPRHRAAAGPAFAGTSGVLGAILVAVGAAALLGKVVWWDTEILLPLTLLAIGAVLLVRPRLDPPSRRAVDAPEPTTSPAPFAEGVAGADDEPAPATTEPVQAGRPPPPGPRAAGTSEPTRERSSLGVLVAGVALVVAGVCWVLAATDAVALSAADVLAAMLVLVGAGLVVGAWWGRARWLIAIAVPLALALAVASLVGIPFRDGFGERTFLPDSSGEVRNEYRLGVGELVIDLSGVEIEADRTLHVRARVGMGSLRVVVPGASAVDARARVRLGEIRFPDGLGGEGSSVEQTWLQRATNGSGRIELDLRAGLGEVTLDRG